MDDIQFYLTQNKAKVEAALWDYLSSSEKIPPSLREAMQYSLKAGGKRIRPILVLAACEAVGGNTSACLPVACALELIHTFSLIHDDLPAMDDDDLRRGVPTNHKVFGEALAILSGDGLLALAFEWMSRKDWQPSIDSNILLEVLRDIAWATGPSGMVGGQVLDMQAEKKAAEESDVEEIHCYKTGRLITVSVTSGAKLVGASFSQLEALKIYGEKMGLAFQIADDVLNVEGSKANMGKSIGSDDQNRKRTYPSLLGLEASKAKASQLVVEALKALEIFDAKANPLRNLAHYIISRDR